MEKFKVGVWSVGVACAIVMCVAAVASVFVQDAGAVSQLKTLTLLCAGGNLATLLCAAAIKVEEARQAEELARVKKINDWYNKLGLFAKSAKPRRTRNGLPTWRSASKINLTATPDSGIVSGGAVSTQVSF